jgi:hypothetical protein
MTLEEVANWSGNIADIGPLYPMVGSEGLLVVIGFVFWIGWHIWQFRMENANYHDDVETMKQNGNFHRALNGERILRAM